jgi:hypothetical protein
MIPAILNINLVVSSIIFNFLFVIRLYTILTMTGNVIVKKDDGSMTEKIQRLKEGMSIQVCDDMTLIF